MPADSIWNRIWHRATKSDPHAAIERAHDLAESGHNTQAQTLCDTILKQHPAHPRLLHLSGVLMLRAGRATDAAAVIARAIAIDDSSHLYHFNLGNAWAALNRPDAAARAYGIALQRMPDFLPALFNLGKAFIELNQLDGAIECLGHACVIAPGNAAAQTELGMTWYRKAASTHLRSDYAQAAAAFSAALALDLPAPPAAEIQIDTDTEAAHKRLNTLLLYADALGNCKRHGEALVKFREVLAASPDDLDALIKTGNCLTWLGRGKDALPYIRRAVERAPEQLAALSMIVSNADYLDDIDASANTAKRFELAARLATPARQTRWRNLRAPSRKLRIGYVSPDLCTHVAMYLFENVLKLHDREHFEWFIYDATVVRDEKSVELRKLNEHWREIDAVPLMQVPQMVMDDQIDLLVDLAGHTSNNRLMVFAHKPAPVQVSWLGYPGSTGLTEIDYLISDAWTSPPQFDRHASETVWRLPHTRFCYQPPLQASAPALPAASKSITFVSCNNIIKLNGQVLALWSRILETLPDSRLLIKSVTLDDPLARRLLSDDLAAAGIALQRTELRGASVYLDTFSTYHDAHIALDPFPFCGGLTSLDALWMGVPVVTLEQELMAGRQTLAFLHNIGHPELIAQTPDDYVRIAVELAQNRARVAAYRAGLRDAMRASPLLDFPAFTRNLEDAYRQMWQRWCTQPA